MDATDLIVLTAILALLVIAVLYIFQDTIKHYFSKKFCKHDWEKIDESDVYENGKTKEDGTYPIYTILTFRCSKCGEFKKIRIN